MNIDFYKFWGLPIGLFLVALLYLVIWKKSAIYGIIDIFNLIWEGKEWSSRLKTPEDFLEYILLHQEDVSLVAYEVGNYDKGVFFNADKKRPLASTIKILILIEYARQVDIGILSPEDLVDLADIDIYYLPNTDGNAHPNAFKEFQTKGYITTDQKIKLQHVATAMIRYSDNAASDYLIQRLGRDNLNNLPKILQTKNQDVPLPFIGQFLSWGNTERGKNTMERLQKYQEMQPADYADEVYQLTKKWRDDQEFRRNTINQIKSTKWLNFKEQQAMAQALNCGGTASCYALLMEKIYNCKILSQSNVQIIRKYLEWPMELAGNQQEIEVFGTKAGSLPGIITEASYLKPKKAKNARVFALLIENIPGAVWLQIIQNYIQQDFEYQLLGDERFFNLVRQRLSTTSKSIKV